MASNEYHILTVWRIPGTPEEIAEVLGAAEDLPLWWPAVYLDVRVVEPGNPRGIGRVVSLYTKGWLPYTLRWRFKVTELALPRTMEIEAIGDFEGRGIWTFDPVRSADDPAGPLTNVTYDWLIVAQKGILKHLSVVMKPIFAANHGWAMRQGERSLVIELARRHAAAGGDPAILAAIPAPPGPTFPHNVLRRGRTST